jgi:hypothetical protein
MYSFLYVGFEVLRAVVVKSTIIWDMSCSPLKVNRHFGGTYCLKEILQTICVNSNYVYSLLEVFIP